MRHLAGFLSLSLLLVPSSGLAWWALWPPAPEPPPPPPIEVPKKFKDAREASCPAATGQTSRFGDTAYMRGTAQLPGLTTAQRGTLAALRLARTAEQAESLAAPLLSSSDQAVSSMSKIALARTYLARTAGWDNAIARARDLLADPSLKPLSDAQYLRGVIGLMDRDWAMVAEKSRAALREDPVYYNAAVLFALSEYRTASLSRLSCPDLFSALEGALAPALSAGACAIHSAHLDLSIERYNTGLASPTAERDRELLRLVLAYVAKNDRLCSAQKAFLRASPYAQSCAPVLDAIKCEAGK